MRKSLLRALTLAGVLGATIWLSVGSAAAAAPPPQPVRPNQFFTGSVNGVTSTTLPPRAVVRVFCPGPIFPGRKGHPAANQPVQVNVLFPPVIFPGLGFTGSTGTSIVATFNNDPSVPLRFTSYGAPQSIPVTLLLPCFGTGQVVFKPTPFGLRARSFILPVRYVDIAP